MEAIVDTLERVRAALAEVGYDPSWVWPEGEMFRFLGAVPPEVGWRAAQLARADDPNCKPTCFTCGSAACYGDVDAVIEAREACLATTIGIIDCGVD